VICAVSGGLLLETVLQFQLRMWRETISASDLHPGEILAPAEFASSAITNTAEELLVPAQRAEKLGSEFIFGLKIISECVRVADTRDFETRLVKFRPHLQMVPGEADILAKNELVIVVNIATARQCPIRFGPEIRAVTR